jgi:hypothetical protein
MGKPVFRFTEKSIGNEGSGAFAGVLFVKVFYDFFKVFNDIN